MGRFAEKKYNRLTPLPPLRPHPLTSLQGEEVRPEGLGDEAALFIILTFFRPFPCDFLNRHPCCSQICEF